MGMFLRRIGLFLSILLLILIVMNYWMDRELYPHYRRQYEEMFSAKVNADVVILGASHATHGINPRYLESDHLKIFNFALNGAGPLFYLKWYQKIFRPYYRKPWCIVYAVHWSMFDDQVLWRELEMDSKYFPAGFLLREFRHMKAVKILLLNRFAFIRERKQLAGRLFGKSNQDVFPVSQYYRGFIPFETKRNLDKRDIVNPRNSETQINAFERLLDEFQKDGIKVIFVQVPGYLPGRELWNVSEGMRLLHQIAERRHIPFLDYEVEKVSAINTDRSLFSDWAHLNGKGSEAFSKLLARDLNPLFSKMGRRVELKDHPYESRHP
jgi:hypothetical protein